MSINLKTHSWAESKSLKSFYYPQITSSNDVAKSEFPSHHLNFALYLTDDQTRGRGRGENSWQNLSNGEILLSTWCFKMESPPQPILTPLLGLALYESLFVFDSSLPIRLKAPNDMYLQNGKLAGLLVEASQQGNQQPTFVYVGLGLNVEAAPTVDMKTSCLKEVVPNYEQHWDDFCKYLYNQFLIAIEKGTQSKLSADDCEDLLEALNAGLDESEQHTEVSPQCDIIGPQGKIPWTSL